MNSHHDAHHGQQHAHSRPAHRMGRSHVLKLFLLNVVLFGACGAFAGLIMGDWVPSGGQLRFLAAVGLVPMVIALVATVVHARAGRWTSVDDMSERFFGGPKA